MKDQVPTRAKYLFGASLSFLLLGIIVSQVDISTHSLKYNLLSSILDFIGIALFATALLSTLRQSRAPKIQIAMSLVALIAGLLVLVPGLYRPKWSLEIIAVVLGAVAILYVAVVWRSHRSGRR